MCPIMRAVFPAVLVVLYYSSALPLLAQQRHWIEPGAVDTFSLCVQESCLEPVWPVANVAITLNTYGVDYDAHDQPAWLAVTMYCRHNNDHNYRMTGGNGWTRIEVATQIAPEHYRWCTVEVQNHDDRLRAEYSLSIEATEPSRARPLWPGRKTTKRGDPSVLGPDDPDDEDTPDPRFDDTFWRQLVFDDYEDPGDESQLAWMLDAPMKVQIVTADDTGTRVFPAEIVTEWRRLAFQAGTLLSGKNMITQVETGPDNPGERKGWILVTPDDSLSGCGTAAIGGDPGWIQIKPSHEHGCLTRYVFQHEMGHALGFYHVDASAFPDAVMKAPRGADASTFSDDEVYHAQLAYASTDRWSTHCGWPYGDECQNGRTALGFGRPLALRTLTEITLLCAERPKPQKTGSAWMHLATLYRSLSLHWIRPPPSPSTNPCLPTDGRFGFCGRTPPDRSAVAPPAHRRGGTRRPGKRAVAGAVAAAHPAPAAGRPCPDTASGQIRADHSPAANSCMLPSVSRRRSITLSLCSRSNALRARLRFSRWSVNPTIRRRSSSVSLPT